MLSSKKLVLVFLIVVFFGIIQPCQATTLFDDFNDGNAYGWVFPYNVGLSQGPGQWSVEDGVLVQRYTGDHNTALVDKIVISDQVIETQMSTVGDACVAFWYQQVNDNVANYVAVDLNTSAGIRVTEIKDGQIYSYPYDYWIGSYPYYSYDLKVNANSETGSLMVYLNDVYLFTHQVNTAYRSGLSGVCSGNAVGYFDNFRLTSSDIPFNIDIKPEDNLNDINTKKMKTVSVAILSTSQFDAFTDVNQSTLAFGATGDEVSWKSCSRKAKDVNGDGLKDLVCTFTVKTAFPCDSGVGILKGKTGAGILFEGSQAVTISPSIDACTP